MMTVKATGFRLLGFEGAYGRDMQLLRNNCHIRANVLSFWLRPTAVLRIKTRTSRGFYTRSPIGRGYAFHPCPIGDPRGRIFRPCRFCQNLRAARANRVFRADEKRIRTENTVMQLLRNNCHIRANVFVILVAAGDRAKPSAGTSAQEVGEESES